MHKKIKKHLQNSEQNETINDNFSNHRFLKVLDQGPFLRYLPTVQFGAHTQSARTYGTWCCLVEPMMTQRWRAKTWIAILFTPRNVYTTTWFTIPAHIHTCTSLLSSNIDTSFVKRKCSAFFAIRLCLVNFNQLTFYREYNDNFAPAHATLVVQLEVWFP